MKARDATQKRGPRSSVQSRTATELWSQMLINGAAAFDKSGTTIQWV